MFHLFSFNHLSYFVFLRIELLSSRAFVSPPSQRWEQYSYCDLLCLRRISYRPRRGKLPSVCWQLPGRFRTPRSIYAVAFYTATRVIYGTTGLAFSLRDHILPPGRPLARKSHYPQVRCHGLRSNAVICFVRLQVNRSPLSGVLAPWPGGFSSRPG